MEPKTKVSYPQVAIHERGNSLVMPHRESRQLESAIFASALLRFGRLALFPLGLEWYQGRDSNSRPMDYDSTALTN